MSLDSDRKRLMQDETLQLRSREMKPTDKILVYLRNDKEGSEDAIYGVLVPLNHANEILSYPAEWDLGFVESVPKAVAMEQPNYLSYDFRETLERLVIRRDFHESQTNFGRRAPYNEISEEFRLFHNLYHDRETDEYSKIDGEGIEEVVANVEPNCVKIRLNEIRQFLAAKQMYLSIQFRHYEFSKHSLKDIGARDAEIKTGKGTTTFGDFCWQRSYWDYPALDNGHQSFSVLEGKRLIEPLPKSQISLREVAGEPREKYLEFIIGVYDNGKEKAYTCDPAIRLTVTEAIRGRPLI